ncbi:MAG: YceI family protein [Granulosicoccus sp.]|nr:YceI family protein [Granulosicoccus sp.]
MKSVFIGLCLFIYATAGIAAPQRFTLDQSHTTVAFLIDHIGYAKTLGQFTDVSGSFDFDQDTGQVANITISVNTASVQTHHEGRDKHVRNKDFLNVKKFPKMEFNAASALIDESGKGVVEGELNLLGQVQPLMLDVQLNKADNYPFGHKKLTLGISARGELMRSAYGMDYGVANALVGDAVALIIEIEAIQE